MTAELTDDAAELADTDNEVQEATAVTDEAFASVVKDLEDTFNSKGDVLVSIVSDTEDDFVPHVSTGIPSVDAALQIGGFPRGRITELFGPQMSGKTTVSLMAIAEAQKTGGYAAFIDMEHALDYDHAVSLGVDMDRLVVATPEYGEQAFDMLDAMLRQNIFDVIVVDSLASMIPKASLDKDNEDDRALGSHLSLIHI